MSTCTAPFCRRAACLDFIPLKVLFATRTAKYLWYVWLNRPITRCDTHASIAVLFIKPTRCHWAFVVIHCGAMQAAEEQQAAEAATDVVIRLGLAAFAVSAYIKTVLCPSMSSYTPRMSSASLVRPLALQSCAY